MWPHHSIRGDFLAQGFIRHRRSNFLTSAKFNISEVWRMAPRPQNWLDCVRDAIRLPYASRQTMAVSGSPAVSRPCGDTGCVGPSGLAREAPSGHRGGADAGDGPSVDRSVRERGQGHERDGLEEGRVEGQGWRLVPTALRGRPLVGVPPHPRGTKPAGRTSRQGASGPAHGWPLDGLRGGSSHRRRNLASFLLGTRPRLMDH
jgi:hypothetical protein